MINFDRGRFEYMKKYSKELIIELLEREVFMGIPESKILFLKWNMIEEELSKKRKEHLEKSSTVIQEYAKSADELAKEFNCENDSKKKLDILERRGVLLKKINDHNKEWGLIDKKYQEGKRIYDMAMEMKRNGK
jgi:hypothetical protein